MNIIKCQFDIEIYILIQLFFGVFNFSYQHHHIINIVWIRRFSSNTRTRVDNIIELDLIVIECPGFFDIHNSTVSII